MFIIRKFIDSSKELTKVQTIAVCAMMLALNTVFAFLSKYSLLVLPNVKIGLMFIPVLLTAHFYGPVCAAIVCAGGDMLSTMINNPTPFAFNPGITACCVLEGIIYGVVLYHSEYSLRNLIIAKVSVLILCHLPLNTVFLSMIMNIPYLTMLWYRAIILIPFAVIEITVMMLLKKPIHKVKNQLKI